MTSIDKIRIGFVAGQSRRINERVIDEQWLNYLGNFTDLVKIPPLSFMKLFDGSIEKWTNRFPESVKDFSYKLVQLCDKYQVKIMYINLPILVPYLLMVRNYEKLDLSIICIAHSIGSPFWLKQWIGIAPLISSRDVLLTSTHSCKKALVNISTRYELAKVFPLCIEVREQTKQEEVAVLTKARKHILAIGRIENVKNIDLLLECFANVKGRISDVHLTIAGEYTGLSSEQVEQFKQYIHEVVNKWGVINDVSFPGVVIGSAKEQLFRKAHLLVNFSTDPGETFGFNLIEAKTWGLPVVCTNWDGFREVVEHDVDGFLVECNWERDIPEINMIKAVEYCEKLLIDEDLWNRMSVMALQNAQKYNYKQIIPKIVEEVRIQIEKPFDKNNSPQSFAEVPIQLLSQVYQLENLKQLPLAQESLLSVLNNNHSEDLTTWMCKVKPIINHFAGGTIYGN